MDNLKIYNAVRTPPKEALKPIKGGRLSGYTDINPMWRLKTLTEQFGLCGVGWKYTIEKQWTEAGANGEITAFTNINLFIKVDGEWSEAIPGTGGSQLVAKERSGLYTSDECYKMALTDAISVACKALGFAADVYWNSDRSKYDRPEEAKQDKARQANNIGKAARETFNKHHGESGETLKQTFINKSELMVLNGLIQKTNTDEKVFLNYYEVDKPEKLTVDQYNHAIAVLKKKNVG